MTQSARELELLVTRCQLGEAEAFDELVERWHPALWRYVRRVCGDADLAEEVLQEGWLRIFRGIDRLREPQRLNAWLYGVVRHTFIERLRRRYADPPSEPIADHLAESDDWHCDPHELDRLRESLASLSMIDREAAVLFYLRELTLDEVASILGVPNGTVKSRLYRVRRQLRDRLRARGVQR